MFYKITNLFPILNYGKSVVQADLFKLQCVKRVILQSPVINTDSDAYACLSVYTAVYFNRIYSIDTQTN